MAAARERRMTRGSPLGQSPGGASVRSEVQSRGSADPPAAGPPAAARAAAAGNSANSAIASDFMGISFFHVSGFGPVSRH